MSTYKRIFALVAFNGDSAFVAKRAVQLSRSYGATLALAAVVDYTPGFESDHVPFLTPGEMRQAIVRDMREKLDQMMTEVGADGCEIIVGCGAMTEVSLTVDVPAQSVPAQSAPATDRILAAAAERKMSLLAYTAHIPNAVS